MGVPVENLPCSYVAGFLYPAYASYKCIKARSAREVCRWLMYWVVMAMFTIAEFPADIFVSW
jgi:hypothetical protein